MAMAEIHSYKGLLASDGLDSAQAATWIHHALPLPGKSSTVGEIALLFCAYAILEMGMTVKE